MSVPTTEEITANLGRWQVWVCPYCARQYRGPGGHHVLGDDSAGNCFHSHPGERGRIQPRLIRVAVTPVADFLPAVVPHDQLRRGIDVRGGEDR